MSNPSIQELVLKRLPPSSERPPRFWSEAEATKYASSCLDEQKQETSNTLRTLSVYSASQLPPSSFPPPPSTSQPSSRPHSRPPTPTYTTSPYNYNPNYPTRSPHSPFTPLTPSHPSYNHRQQHGNSRLLDTTAVFARLLGTPYKATSNSRGTITGAGVGETGPGATEANKPTIKDARSTNRRRRSSVYANSASAQAMPSRAGDANPAPEFRSPIVRIARTLQHDLEALDQNENALRSTMGPYSARDGGRLASSIREQEKDNARQRERERGQWDREIVNRRRSDSTTTYPNRLGSHRVGPATGPNPVWINPNRAENENPSRKHGDITDRVSYPSGQTPAGNTQRPDVARSRGGSGESGGRGRSAPYPPVSAGAGAGAGAGTGQRPPANEGGNEYHPEFDPRTQRRR